MDDETLFTISLATRDGESLVATVETVNGTQRAYDSRRDGDFIEELIADLQDEFGSDD